MALTLDLTFESSLGSLMTAVSLLSHLLFRIPNIDHLRSRGNSHINPLMRLHALATTRFCGRVCGQR